MPLTKRIQNTKERSASTAKVGKFELGDLEPVLLLAQKYASWDATPTREDIEGFHSANPEVFFVAEFNKKVVGFAYGRESNPPAEVLDKWKSRKVASIEMMAVDEDYRRRGIATLLLTALSEEFKRSEFDLVTLSVPAAEKAARKMYGKMGFELRGRVSLEETIYVTIELACSALRLQGALLGRTWPLPASVSHPARPCSS